MATIEQVEKLREKANVTYDEAKSALDACGGDILDALIYLEKQGRVTAPKNDGYYNSNEQTQHEEEPKAQTKQEEYHQHGHSFGQLVRIFLSWCRKIIVKGNMNMFEVWRRDTLLISLPVTVLALLLIFAFWIVVPSVIVGLFFGYRYIFKGPDLGSEVNKYMNSAANAAESIKKEVREEFKDK